MLVVMQDEFGSALKASDAVVGEAGMPISPQRGSRPLAGEELKDAIMRQVEYYLSRENLARDTYLVNQMNEDAFAPIKLIANFSKMKSFTTDASVILEAIKMSSKLQVDDAGVLVRPLDMASEAKRKSTVILRDVDSTVPEEEIRALFDEGVFGPIERVRSDIGDTWFIELAGEISSDAESVHMTAIEKIRSTKLRVQRIVYICANARCILRASALRRESLFELV